MLSHQPASAEVAVVGRPDEYWGEEVVAVVVPSAEGPLDLAQLAAWAHDRMARTKVPRELVVIDALPLGPSGKVLKRELRRRLEQGALVPEALDAPS